jgi:hypothetical protein
MKEKIICHICYKEFNSILSLSRHIKPAHSISSKDYFDKFIKKEKSGLCSVCSNPTRFVNFGIGYKKYCSNSCHNRDKKALTDIRDALIYEEKIKTETIVFDCEICGYKIFNNYHGIGSHLKHKHNLSIQEYYDKYYLENILDKKCNICDRETSFRSLEVGYTKYCSISCSNKEEVNILARKKGINKKEVKERQSRNLSQRILNGTFNPFAKKFKTGYFYSEKNQKDLYYRSSYELKAYQMLEQMSLVNIYETEPFRIPYKDMKGVTRNYIPDILIIYEDGMRELVEVKPENLLKDETIQIKTESAKQYCKANNMSFNIWTEKFLEL